MARGVVSISRGIVAGVERWREPFLPRFVDDGSSYVVTRTVILRLLGVVYFVAFLSARV